MRKNGANKIVDANQMEHLFHKSIPTVMEQNFNLNNTCSNTNSISLANDLVRGCSNFSKAKVPYHHLYVSMVEALRCKLEVSASNPSKGELSGLPPRLPCKKKKVAYHHSDPTTIKFH